MARESSSFDRMIDRLRPVHIGLRSDLEFTRHVFRGQSTYIVRDPITFQTHQFSQMDYQIVIAIHDDRSLGDSFSALVNKGTVDEDQEEAFYHFILSLHHLGFLRLPLADSALLYRRFALKQRAARIQRFTSIMFLRVPLLNPDTFLDRTVDWFRPLFTRWALGLWVLLMGVSVNLLMTQWDRFRSPVHSLLANESIVFLWVALIGLKVFHEFGHAYACKIFGGKVPEMGAFFILFTPCAYVDASSAWSFPRKSQRIVVSLAGMYFETITAAIAILVWSWTDNPVLGSCAHHVVLLASIITIGFNLNPLMRYDGYYLFSDLIGIPNLRQRAMQQVQRIAKRLILGICPEPFSDSLGTRQLLTIYGVAAVAYRVSLVLAICTMIALKFYLVGIGLAVMFIGTLVTRTAWRLAHYLWRSPETAPIRRRAIATGAVAFVVIPMVIALVPVPGHTVVQGVIRTRDDRVLHAPTNGFLQEVDLPTGSRVTPDQPICQFRNTVLQTVVAELSAVEKLQQLVYRTDATSSPLAATSDALRLAQTRRALENARSQCDDLRFHVPSDGELSEFVDARDLGKFFAKGDRIGLCADGPWVTKCLVDSRQLADIAPQVGQHVPIRFATATEVIELVGTIEEIAEQGTSRVSELALTHLGGGDISIAPDTGQAEQPMFELIVRLPQADARLYRRGIRVHLRMATTPESYGAWSRRQLSRFLNRLRTR